MRRVTRPPAWSKHLGLLVALSLLLGSVAVPPAGGARAASPPYPPAAGSATPAASPSPLASPTPTLPPGTTPTATVVPSPTVTVPPTSPLTPTPTGTPHGPPTQTITPTPPPDPTPTPPDWAVILPGEGGVLASPDGWVRVDFPPGAVTAPAGAAFSLVETPPYASPADPFYRFDLSAWDLATGEPVTAFGVSLTVTLSYSETAVVRLNEASLRLVSWDPETAGWLPLPGEVDLVENRIRAALGHFSLLGAQGDPAAVVAETFKAYQTDLFAGSAGYGFDLEAPSGPNGLAPSLSLRYNSGAVNQMKAPYSPGTWVGSGWSLDLGYVEYQEATGEYSLVLNGASHRIVYDDDTSAYHTHPESFVKVTRSAVGTRWWEVTAKDGTTYRFGQTLEEDTRYGGSYGPSVLFYQVGDAQNRCKRHLLKWYLDEVEDTHGNVLGIVHQAPQTERNLDCDHTCPECDNGYYPVEVYPYRVLYSTNASAGDGVAEYQVEFTLEERYDEGVDDHVPDGTLNFETQRLSEVTVTAATEDVTSYHFTYDGTHYPLALTEVQQYGAGGSVSLPAVTFGYERMELSFRVQQGTGECETEQAYGDRPFLTSVQNGYGGTLAVGYAAWGPCEPDAGGDWFSEPFRESGWGRQAVVTYTLSGRVEGSPEVSYTYGYTNGVQAGGSFVGFEEGRTSDAAGNDSTLEHYAHGSDAEHILNGKVEEARHYQGSSTLVKETVNTWETDSLWGEESDFVWLDRVVERSCGPGGCQSKKTAYDYDPAMQGGAQYGNVTGVREYESDTAQTPVRTTRRWYNTRDDSSAYIVDRLQTEAVYPEASWTEASKTWYYYDTYDSHQQQVGVKGELWAVQRFFQKRPDGQDWLWDAAETRYTYDAYGNQVSATAYAGKAVMRVTSSWEVSHVEGPTLPRTTTTEYDAAFHTFPVAVRHPAAGDYTPVETREYYGVNESDTDTGDGVFGQVKRVRDTKNGTDTWAQYDAFGRLTYRWLPGDTPVWEPAYASQAYGYDDTARRLYSRQRDDLGGSSPAHLESWQFYDGLGRLVQAQAESAVTDQVLVTDRAYDALGKPEKESLPYFLQASGGTYAAPDWEEPHTVRTYDALGRPVHVTNPDGTYTEHHYDVVTDGGVDYTYDDVLDANRHRKQYRSDALGRLRYMVEMAGDCGAWVYSCGGSHTTPWSVYATTRYEYGVTDNLAEVADAAGNVTEMAYDLMGRKTAMSDPDVGEWSYGYDAVGNLSRQDDAKHQRTCFYYDDLNRLTGKYYTNDQTDCPSSPTCPVSYGYDAGTNGKGRRTSMTDGSGSTSWSYDLRGRTTQESKAINGAPGSPFVTSYSFDAMDRVVTMTYPDGEVVQNSYNAAAQLAEVRSATYALNYATGLAYDALGQLTQMTYGNNVQTRLGYWGTGGAWDSRPGSGLVNFGRLYRLRATNGNGGAPLIDLRYNYDPAGNVTQIKEPPAAASGWPFTFFSFQDNFTSKNTTDWWWSAHQSVPDAPNNWVKSLGTGSNYDAHFYRTSYSLSSGQGLQVRLKVSQTDANAHVSIEANDATYRRFGVIASSGKLYVQYNDGNGYRYPSDLLTGLQADTWYVVRIVVDDVRGFYVEAYQESNPTLRGSYNTWMPTGKQWRFHHWNYRGTAYLDTYREFSTAGMTWSPDERMAFGYDALDRLTSAAPEGGAQGYNETYQYYPIGNLKNKNGVEYTYPASGQGSVRPHAVGSTTGGGSFGYDSNGNMTGRRLTTGGTAYTQGWDQENRLISVTGGAQASAMVYDGDGNLVKKTVGSTTTVYIGAYFERTGDVTTSYYYAGGTRVAKRSGGVVTYLHGDHLGSASLATSSSGAVVTNSSTRYYPYGTTRSGGTGLPTDYRFTGQLLDASSGLYHMGARWYDGALGRWLSADAVVPEPGSPQSFNRYAYVGNRPLNHTDPSGHIPCGAACPYDWTNWEFNPDAEYQGSYDPGQQAANRAMAQRASSLTIDLGPSGDLKGLIEVVTGRDLITGEGLGNWRWAGLAGLVGLGEIRYLRNADDAGDALRLLFKVGDTIEATGQWHHLLPKEVMRALEGHQTLHGIFERSDFLVRASDPAGHTGYQAWHRAYDAEVVRWLQDSAHAEATQKEFLEFLLEIHGRPDMLERFPWAVDLLNLALETLE